MKSAIKNNKGISLIEVVVAIMIITVGMVGVLSLVIQNIEAQYINKNVLIASSLAQEGLEIVRNIRDLNWLTTGYSWYQNLIEPVSGQRRFAIDYTGRTSIIDITGVNDAAANLKIDGYGFYWHGAGAASLFNRQILVEKKFAGGAEYLDVKCTIRWVEAGQNHDYTAETYLYDWRSGGELPVCAPNCTGKVCGDDGCGGSCGSCSGSQSCVAGACVDNPPTSPTNLALSHTANNKAFTLSWTAGTGNGGVNGCKLQYLQSGSTWTDITSGANVNCDTTLSNGAFTLNADGWKVSWNATEVRLVRKSDSTAVGTFPQTLACSSLAGSATATPNIDEDCNGAWDNTTQVNCQQVCDWWGCWFRYERWSIYPTCSGTLYGISDGCFDCGHPLGCFTGQNFYLGPGDACCGGYSQACDTLYN